MVAYPRRSEVHVKVLDGPANQTVDVMNCTAILSGSYLLTNARTLGVRFLTLSVSFLMPSTAGLSAKDEASRLSGSVRLKTAEPGKATRLIASMPR